MIFYFTEYLTFLSSRQSVPEEWSVMVYAIQTCLIKTLGEEIVFSDVKSNFNHQHDGQGDADSLSERQTTAEVVKVSSFSKNITCSHLTAIN